MGFLDPINLLFGLSIGGLILIYLSARSRSTVEVSSLLLFEADQVPVSRLRFLKLDLLFWLEVLALALLSLALAGLYLKMAPIAASHRRHALVFDLAAGMGAYEGRQTRLEEAKAQALDIVRSAAPGERFAVVGFASQAEIQRYFTSDLSAVRTAIEGLKPYDVASTPAAVEAALLRVRDADVIDLFAPRLPAGAASFDKVSGTRLRYHQIGTDQDNAAVTALDPGRPPDQPRPLHGSEHVREGGAGRRGNHPQRPPHRPCRINPAGARSRQFQLRSRFPVVAWSRRSFKPLTR